MSRWPRAIGLSFLVALIWSGVTGCSRKLAVPTSAVTTGGAQLPFHRALDGDGVSPTERFGSETVPPELSIRLRSLLSSATSRAGDSFDAVLDVPIVIAGKTVAPRGAAVTGAVLDARASTPDDAGYLRVTVKSILMNGKSIPVEASSIFAKGGVAESKIGAVSSPADQKDAAPQETAGYENGSTALPPREIRFSTGHRFTFRLIQSLHP
jgi:hypothetical protein